MSRIFYTTHLTTLYGADKAHIVEGQLRKVIERYRNRISFPASAGLTEKDVILITYGDQIQQAHEAPLKTLMQFCNKYLKNIISSLHVLPFYPWSSDDGFAVKEYSKVDPALGSWEEIEGLRKSFRLMFDAVINHVSAQGSWFQSFLDNQPPYRDYFITIDGNPDLTKVVRPRTLPLLHEFQTMSGPRKVWTTFSADQVDLNYHNPEVLLTMIEILLEYVSRGAFFLRLDAIAYVWKEIGTSCVHLPQTHALVQLIRAVMDEVAPFVHLLTETNVSHQENLSYFGDGTNEAHLIYNFALPPLVLHTLLSGDSTRLSNWASELNTPSRQTYFFNFLASHDGIGINAVRGILSPGEIDHLLSATTSHGGRISYSQSQENSQIPYELNINYFDALSNPEQDEPLALQVKRFLIAQSIMLCLGGLPGIYFHSLVGSRNWQEGVIKSGKNRSINREKLMLNILEQELHNPDSIRSQVFNAYRDLLIKRRASSAFNPSSKQEIIRFGKGIFAIMRTSISENERFLCLHNVTSETQTAGSWILPPYETVWIRNP